MGRRSSFATSAFSSGTNLCMRCCMPHINSITISLWTQVIFWKKSRQQWPSKLFKNINRQWANTHQVWFNYHFIFRFSNSQFHLGSNHCLIIPESSSLTPVALMALALSLTVRNPFRITAWQGNMDEHVHGHKEKIKQLSCMSQHQEKGRGAFSRLI